MENGLYTVQIRRDLGDVKPNAEQIDGKTYYFEVGWAIGPEFAMIPRDRNYPADAPTWIDSGDLVAQRRQR